MGVADIILKYRPTSWKEVVGHEQEIASIRDAVVNESAHSFLLTGPSGVGKTTIARILAKDVGCDPINLQEVDAASRTGIDAMRDITEKLVFTGFGKTPTKVVVVDEAHALSGPAWQSLLKAVEEPPNHVYWVFCTTVSSKVPKTIRTRCHSYDLKPVPTADLYDNLLVPVAEKEGIEAPEDVVYLAAQAAEGSPRQALTNLSKVATCRSRKEAAALLAQPGEDAEVIELIRAVVNKKPWKDVAKMLNALGDSNPEALRIQTLRYLRKVLLSMDNEDKAAMTLAKMMPFLEPYSNGATIDSYIGSVAETYFG